ncbi:MAG TPA: MFS transporter [Streptosporangiaceae bacterium]|nr:MFS transporter [Streptosporangiaceae bacterium]
MSWPSRVFLSGQAVSLLGDGLAVLAIPLLVLGLTRSPLISALSAASVTLGYLAVGLPAGVLVDRLDAWRVLVAMDAARAAGFGALYLLWVTGHARLWVIMTIALAAGAASVFFETALVVVVKDLFPGPGLIRANSVLELASQAALVAGPAVVGVLAAAGELGAALLADAVTFGVSLVTLVAVRGNVPHLSRRAGGGWRALTADFRAGLAYLLSVRVLVIMTVVQVIVNLCLATEKLMFFYARDTLGLGAAGVGAVVAAGGAGGIAGALSTTWLAARVGQMRLVVLAVAASGLAIGSVSATGSLVTLAAANLAYLWAITVASLANRTYRQLIVPRDLLGRVTSTVRLLFLTADPVGVVIAGSLTVALGGNPRPVFLGAGLLVTVTAAAGWRAGLRRAGPPGAPS